MNRLSRNASENIKSETMNVVSKRFKAISALAWRETVDSWDHPAELIHADRGKSIVDRCESSRFVPLYVHDNVVPTGWF